MEHGLGKGIDLNLFRLRQAAFAHYPFQDLLSPVVLGSTVSNHSRYRKRQKSSGIRERENDKRENDNDREAEEEFEEIGSEKFVHTFLLSSLTRKRKPCFRFPRFARK